MYHYAGNNPVRYTDPDGRRSGYLNVSTGAFGNGHSAFFVELYDENGNSAGFRIYEVNSVTDGTAADFSDRSGVRGKNKTERIMENSRVLSAAPTSGIASSSTSGGYKDSGVFSKDYLIGTEEGKYATRDEAYNAMMLDNTCFDYVFVIETTVDQDKAIKAEAENRGKNFGKYYLLSNNCTQFAIECLKKGGWISDNKVRPNSERKSILKNNPQATSENWSKLNIGISENWVKLQTKSQNTGVSE